MHMLMDLFTTYPRQSCAIIAAILLPVAFLWRLEYSLPDQMGAHWMRLTLLLGSLVLGPVACCSVLMSWSGVVPGLIAGLLSEGVRQAALYFLAKKFPGLTSIPAMQFKVTSTGELGVKLGDDPTIIMTPAQKAQVLAAASQTTPPVAVPPAPQQAPLPESEYRK